MSVAQTQNLPAPFITELGETLADQITAQGQIPTVTSAPTQFQGESAEILQRDNKHFKTFKLDNKV